MTTRLKDFVDVYVAAKNQERPIGHELATKTRSHILETIKAYEIYLQRPPCLEDLSPDRINEALIAWTAEGKAPATIKGRRAILRALLAYARSAGLTVADPSRIRRVACPAQEVDGYNADQMQTLLAASGRLEKNVRGTGIPRSIYFVSMLLLMWNIGCRIGDISEIAVDKFERQGRLWVLEKKTRKARWHRLHDTTRNAIIACIDAMPDRQKIWPGYTTTNLGRRFGELAKSAGLGGTSRFIRRGSSSELDRLQPGQGWRFLNHSNPQVFEKHYRVKGICEDETLAPPELQINDSIRRLCATVAVPVEPRKPKLEVQPTPDRATQAAKINGEWQTIERLTCDVIRAAIVRCAVTQTQLARGIGFSLDWLNAMVCGRQPVGKDADFRIRLFFQQLADGAIPKPLGKKQAELLYATPLDVPLPHPVRKALSRHRVGKEGLSVLVEHLRAIGIPQRKLAEWWGVKFKRYQDFRYGYRRPSLRTSNQLRKAFGLPPRFVLRRPKIPLDVYIAPGSLQATPEIAAVLNAPSVNAEQLGIVITHLNQTLHIKKWHVAANLGICGDRLSVLLQGGGNTVRIIPKLRSLFALSTLEDHDGQSAVAS